MFCIFLENKLKIEENFIFSEFYFSILFNNLLEIIIIYKGKKRAAYKFYIMFIIYSVLRNVGPQPVGLLSFFFLSFFTFFSFDQYLINKHHNVNFFFSSSPYIFLFHFFSFLISFSLY